MTLVKVDIGTTAYQNIRDVSTRDGISPILIDGYKNEAGSDVKRPGLVESVDLGTGAKIDGLYWSPRNKITLAVSNGKVWKISDGIKTELTGASLEVGRKVAFEEVATDTNIYMANGGKIISTDGTTLTELAGSPSAVTSLEYMSGYLFAEDENDKVIYFSTQLTTAGATVTFPILNFIDPGIQWDEVRGLLVGWNEIYTFGSDSTQIWFQTGDATDPFNSLEGAFLEDGLLSRDTIEKIDTSIYYLNKNKEVVQVVGRQKKEISNPFNRELRSYDNLTDARSMQIQIDGRKFYVITFPTQDITLAYDTVLGYWSQWAEWYTKTGDYLAWHGVSTTYDRENNIQYIGHKQNGKIYKMSNTYYDDAGNDIKFLRRTGHINHGTDTYKIQNRLYIKTKRGQLDDSLITTPNALIRWSDDGSKKWTPLKEISLGNQGDVMYVVQLNRGGRYRTRQYEISMTENMPFELVNPFEEDVDEAELGS